MEQNEPIERWELSTKIPLSQPLSARQLAQGLLNSLEFEKMTTEQWRISIFEKVVFSGKESIYRAILQICDPKFINTGAIHASKQPYFNWTKAKKEVARKYGLSSFDFVGTRNKAVGLMLSSLITNGSDEHRSKVVALDRDFRRYYPKIRLDLRVATCTETKKIACNLNREPLTIKVKV
jgi:hypothetical protein